MRKRLTNSQMDPCSPCILSLLVFFFPGGGDCSSSPTPQSRCGAAADVAWDIIDWQRQHEWKQSLWGFEAGLYWMVNFPSLFERKSSFRRRVSESNWHLAGRATPISCQRPAHPHTVKSCQILFILAKIRLYKLYSVGHSLFLDPPPTVYSTGVLQLRASVDLQFHNL